MFSNTTGKGLLGMDEATRDEVASLLGELVVWTRFANLDRLVTTLRNVLADERHARAYELTDGRRSQAEVAKLAGLSQPAVSGLWARWRRIGIVDDRGTRPRHLIRPSDYGLTPTADRQID